MTDATEVVVDVDDIDWIRHGGPMTTRGSRQTTDPLECCRGEAGPGQQSRRFATHRADAASRWRGS